MDIIHRPVFYLRRNASETGLCLRLHDIKILSSQTYQSYLHRSIFVNCCRLVRLVEKIASYLDCITIPREVNFSITSIF
jgi:hypothetical protein